MALPTQTPPAAPYADDEISLWELWQTLVKRKWLIVSSLLVCLAAGAAFAFLKAPVYEASVKLRIGQVKQDSDNAPNLLEGAEELSSRLLAGYGEDVANGIKRERPFITKAAVQKGVTTTLQLTAEGDTPQSAADLLNKVAADVREAHQVMFVRNTQPVEQRLVQLNEQRATLQQQYTDLTQLAEQLKAKDNVQASLVMLERVPLSNSINQLDVERLALERQLAPPQTRQTELLGDIVAPAKPSKPKKGLVLALAAMLGLMGGVMLAFFVEFVAKSKANQGNLGS